MIREWDAATYDRVADPQFRWGAAVLERLPLTGTERVLDAGCGSGRVTELLVERLPEGHVLALDASSAMLEQARGRLARFGDRVEFLLADLTEPLPTDQPVDAILSTATFHWIPDHDVLFQNLASVVRPGGRLVAQCGGRGNVASVMRVVAEIGVPDPGPPNFAGPLDTTDRLANAGFIDIEAWLSDAPTTFQPGEPFLAFLRTVILRRHLAILPEPEREPFVREVAARLGEPVLDYVRLNILATRGPVPA